MEYAKYTLAADGMILKDGHTMFTSDVVKDLNRKSHLESEVVRIKEIETLLGSCGQIFQEMDEIYWNEDSAWNNTRYDSVAREVYNYLNKR